MTRTAREAAHVGNIINIAMGVWLFASAFVWPRAPAERMSTLVTGAVIASLAMGALKKTKISWLDALPAVWLFGTALSFEHARAFAPWHDVVIAAVVFLSSLSPIAAAPFPPRRSLAPRA